MLWVLLVILLIVIIVSVSRGNKKKTLEVQKMQKEIDEPTITEAPKTNPPGSIADELVKLKNLKDSGVLSEEEFERQKEKILN